MSPAVILALAIVAVTLVVVLRLEVEIRRRRAARQQPAPTPQELAARQLFNAVCDDIFRVDEAALKWGCTLGEAQTRLAAGVCPHCGRGA